MDGRLPRWMATGWPPYGHHSASLPGLLQLDLERLWKPLKMTDVDAFGAAPSGPPADRLVHVPEDRQAWVVFVDRFDEARPVHLQPPGDDVVAQRGDVRRDV